MIDKLKPVVLIFILLSSCKTDKIESKLEIENLNSLISHKEDLIEHFLFNKPNPRTIIFYKKTGEIKDLAYNIINQIDSGNIDNNNLKMRIDEFARMVNAEIDEMVYLNSKLYDLDFVAEMPKKGSEQQIIRKILFHTYLILDYYSESMNVGDVAVNKFYAKLIEDHLFVSANDSSGYLGVLIEKPGGYDTLDFDFQKGCYPIDLDKYSNEIRGKIQSYSTDFVLGETDFTISLR
jgi:hypothetical protein